VYAYWLKSIFQILSEDDFQKVLDMNAAASSAAVADIAAGLIPDLSNIVAGYAVGPAADSAGAHWTAICDMLGEKCNKPATDASINSLEGTLKIALPPYLKSLLRVSDGVPSGKYVDHPRFLWPSVEELLARNTGNHSDVMLKKLRLLSIGESDQNCDDCIDLRSHWVITLSTEPDMDGIFPVMRNMADFIALYHDAVKFSYDAFQSRLAATQGAKTELELLREEVNAFNVFSGDRRNNTAPPVLDETDAARIARESDELSSLKAAHFGLDRDDIENGRAWLMKRVEKHQAAVVAAIAAAAPGAGEIERATATDAFKALKSTDDEQSGRNEDKPDLPYQYKVRSKIYMYEYIMLHSLGFCMFTHFRVNIMDVFLCDIPP
jgi:hypothetical protein